MRRRIAALAGLTILSGCSSGIPGLSRPEANEVGQKLKRFASKVSAHQVQKGIVVFQEVSFDGCELTESTARAVLGSAVGKVLLRVNLREIDVASIDVGCDSEDPTACAVRVGVPTSGAQGWGMKEDGGWETEAPRDLSFLVGDIASARGAAADLKDVISLCARADRRPLPPAEPPARLTKVGPLPFPPTREQAVSYVRGLHAGETTNHGDHEYRQTHRFVELTVDGCDLSRSYEISTSMVFPDGRKAARTSTERRVAHLNMFARGTYQEPPAKNEPRSFFMGWPGEDDGSGRWAWTSGSQDGVTVTVTLSLTPRLVMESTEAGYVTYFGPLDATHKLVPLHEEAQFGIPVRQLSDVLPLSAALGALKQGCQK